MSSAMTTVRYRVDGFNQLRLLDALRKNGIRWSNLVRVAPDQMLLDVPKKLEQKYLALLRKMCYNSHRIRDISPLVALRWLAKRLGLVFGLVLASCALWLSNGFVWRVQLDGNVLVQPNTVQQLMAARGVSTARWADWLPLDLLRQDLLQLDEVVDAMVWVDGTTLRIELFEKLPSTDHTDPDLAAGISRFDAVVTQIVVTEGTASVAVGDTVKVGDELIAPRVMGNDGEILRPAVPQGQVFGQVTLAVSRLIPEQEVLLVRTGRTHRTTELALMGLRWGGDAKHGFELFQAVTRTERLALLPVCVTQSTYYELERRTQPVPIADRTEQLTRQIRSELILAEGGQLVSERVDVRPFGAGCVRLDYFAVAKMQIN